MNICKEDIVRVGKGFGGNLRNDASLDFALEKQKNTKLGEYKKLAYLIRALVIDHPFTDGNKKTAAYVILAFAEQFNKQVDFELVKEQMISIASKNINSIRAIEERIKNVLTEKIKFSLSSKNKIPQVFAVGEKEIQRIFKKYKNIFEEMEHYDRTREKLWAKKRIDITLTQRVINRLREVSSKTGKPVSHIIEEAVSKI